MAHSTSAMYRGEFPVLPGLPPLEGTEAHGDSVYFEPRTDVNVVDVPLVRERERERERERHVGIRAPSALSMTGQSEAVTTKTGATKASSSAVVTKELARRASTAVDAFSSLKNAMGQADDTGIKDGDLDATEAGTLDPALYERLGLSNATELISSFDKDGNGKLDAFERVELLRALLDTVKPEMLSLAEDGRWEDAEVVRKARATMRGELQHEEAASWTEHIGERERTLAAAAEADLAARKKAWEERAKKFEQEMDRRVDVERQRYAVEVRAIDNGDDRPPNAGRLLGPLTPKMRPSELDLTHTMTQCARNYRYAQAVALQNEHDMIMGFRTNELGALARERAARLRAMAEARHRDIVSKLRRMRVDGRKKLEMIKTHDLLTEQRKQYFRYKSHAHVHKKINIESASTSTLPNRDARLPVLPVEPATEPEDLRAPVQDVRPRTMIGRFKHAARLEQHYNNAFFTTNDGGSKFRPTTALDLEWMRRGRIPRVLGNKTTRKLVPTVGPRVVVPPAEFRASPRKVAGKLWKTSHV